MKFEKSNIKTVLDIDELSVGDEGYFAYGLLDLKDFVERENKKFYGKILDINLENESDDCFKSDIDGIYRFYFYPVKKG